MSAYQNDELTIAGTFAKRVALTPNKTAYVEFSDKDNCWQDYSWQQISALSASIQFWLQTLPLSAGDSIALMLSNSVYWVAIDQAAAGLGLITVPLYPNDRADNVEYILTQTSARILFIDSSEQCKLSRRFVENIDSLTSIVSVKKLKNENIKALVDLLPSNIEAEFQVRSVHCDDPATIVYTSGTTGRPKGVVLSHRNVLSNAAAASRSVLVGEQDRLLSFLPLSHTFERTVGYYAPMMHGAEIVYARSVDKLAEDLKTMHPTVLISVPRIYEKVYDRIQAKLQAKNMLSRKLFNWTHSIGYRRYCYKQNTATWSFSFLIYPLLDRLVAKKIREGLGGHLKYAVAGGAAFSGKLNAFFLGMGVNVLQGYGMTESSPVISTNLTTHNIVGSVGKLLDNVEATFTDVGELMVRGPSIMQGYLNNPEATHEVMTDEGWLHTGDIARIDNDFLFITGRVKEIIVLSNGEKIPPHDVEHAICTDTLIDQCIVIGERRSFLSAIVVLNVEQCKKLKIATNNLSDERYKKILLERISARMKDFPGYAQVYQVTATVDPWEIENGLMTPTLKIKREKVKALFEQEIEKMYSR